MDQENADAMSGKRNYTVTAADRALTVLEILAEHPGIGLTELAQRMRVTKSLAFRLLQTLEARKFVDKDPERSTYTLGYRMLYFGQKTEQQISLIQSAGPILDDLCERSDENINLLIRDGFSSLCVATRESRHHMRLFAQAGRRGPLHAGGSSAVICAYAPKEVQEAVLAQRLETFTRDTLVVPDQLKARWADIRANGYHIVQGDLDDGAFSIAAPVRDHSGEVVAAISVAGPISRLNEAREREREHLKNVLEAAQAISARLGYRELAAAAMAIA